MVVSMDAFMPQIESTVGAWHYQAGQLAAEYINKAIGGKGEVAIIQGLPKSSPAITRTQGFKEWFEANNKDVTVVAVQNADWDRMKAKDITDIWLKQYPNLKGVYANNDTMAMGALESARAVDKIGKLVIVGTDGTSEAKESIANDELTATIDSFPYYMAQISTEIQHQCHKKACQMNCYY
jgi:ribose transport system substrate-binding protein